MPLAPELPALEKTRIIVFEDDPYLKQSITKFLRNHGWEPIAAEDLVGARQYIHSGTRDVPDVYLIDLKMPESPGADIIRSIRLAGLRSSRTKQHPRIVVFTALDVFDRQVKDAVDAGADAVVQKSSDIDHLIAVCEGNHPGDVPIPVRLK